MPCCAQTQAGPAVNAIGVIIDGDQIERAELLGLDFLVMHPGAHVGSGVDAAIERIATGMRECFRRVPHVKTRILLENTAGGGSTMGRSFEELRDLLEAIDTPERTGTCLDTCHIFAAGYPISEPPPATNCPQIWDITTR